MQNADTILQGKAQVADPHRLNKADWEVQPKDYTLYAVKYKGGTTCTICVGALIPIAVTRPVRRYVMLHTWRKTKRSKASVHWAGTRYSGPVLLKMLSKEY